MKGGSTCARGCKAWLAEAHFTPSFLACCFKASHSFLHSPSCNKTNSFCFYIEMILLTSQLQYIVFKSIQTASVEAAHLPLFLGDTLLVWVFVCPGLIQASVQKPQRAGVWPGLFHTPQWKLTLFVHCANTAWLRKQDIHIQPEPSVVSDLDDGCTCVNGALANSAWPGPLIRGYISNRFYSSAFHLLSNMGGENHRENKMSWSCWNNIGGLFCLIRGPGWHVNGPLRLSP